MLQSRRKKILDLYAKVCNVTDGMFLSNSRFILLFWCHVMLIIYDKLKFVQRSENLHKFIERFTSGHQYVTEPLEIAVVL